MPLLHEWHMGRPDCPMCGARTYLVPREPHPQQGMPVELRTFECPTCNHRLTQDAFPQPRADTPSVVKH
jgi:hypothetical protein